MTGSLSTDSIASLTTTSIGGFTNLNSWTFAGAPNWQSWSSIPITPPKPIVHPPKGNIMVSDGKGGFDSMEPLDFFLTWMKKESKTEQARFAMAEVMEKFSDLLMTLKMSRSDEEEEE
jgi:hypothetical protein